MATNFVLTLTAPQEYGVEAFDTDPSIWAETDSNKTETSRYTSDPDRDSVMKIQGVSWKLGDGCKLGDGYYLGDSPIGRGEGAYKDYNVAAGVRYAFACLHRMDRGTLTIQLYDQTNGALLHSVNKTDTSWKSHEVSVVAPLECTTIRVKFLQKSDNVRPGPFYVDNVALNGNILLHDPDIYQRIPHRIGSFHQTLSGRRIYDLRGIHYSFNLDWSYFEETQYENLREAFYSNELLYFDDGNVPPLIESDTIYDNATYNFAGIASPSSTHKAYIASSSSLPSAKNDFETTEFTTVEYQTIAVDDADYKETTNPETGCYLYHKFLFKSGITSANTKRLRVKVVALSDDASPANLDGCILYGWGGSNWVELTRSTNSAKTNLTYSTAEEDIASQFVDANDGYIRLLLRSRNSRVGSSNLSLRTYYAEVELNEGLDLVISLSHKAILAANGDVIYVKNITQGTTLILNTHYTISNDRRSIAVTGQNSGDRIEVKYNRYFEVVFASIPEEWLSGDPGSGRTRAVGISLNTLSESR